MENRTYAIRWSFLGIWLIMLFILATYVQFSIFRFGVELFGSLCWYKIGAFLDQVEGRHHNARRNQEIRQKENYQNFLR